MLLRLLVHSLQTSILSIHTHPGVNAIFIQKSEITSMKRAIMKKD